MNDYTQCGHFIDNGRVVAECGKVRLSPCAPTCWLTVNQGRRISELITEAQEGVA